MRKALVFNILLLTIFFTAIPILSHAGGSGTGGAKGIVCRNQDKSIKSIELLDLWEERIIRNRQPIQLTGSPVDELAKVMERAKYIISTENVKRPDGSVFKVVDQTLSEIKLVSEGFLGLTNFMNIKRVDGVQLKPTEDAFEEIMPNIESGCELEQIVRYDFSSGNWLVNMDLVNKMDLTQRIALALHESLYSLLHSFGESNSLRVRRAVGFLMTGGEFKPIESFLKKPYIHCSSPGRLDELIAKQDPIAALILQSHTSGDVYFVQDPRVMTPSLTAVITHIGRIPLIDYNYQTRMVVGANPNLTAEEYFKKHILNKNESLTWTTGGWSSDIEFQTKAQIDIRNGTASLTLIESTGVKKEISTPIQNMKCQLIK